MPKVVCAIVDGNDSGNFGAFFVFQIVWLAFQLKWLEMVSVHLFLSYRTSVPSEVEKVGLLSKTI